MYTFDIHLKCAVCRSKYLEIANHNAWSLIQIFEPDPWYWYWWNWSNPIPLLLLDSEVILAIWKVYRVTHSLSHNMDLRDASASKKEGLKTLVTTWGYRALPMDKTSPLTPVIFTYKREEEEEAKEKGVIFTLQGRRRRIMSFINSIILCHHYHYSSFQCKISKSKEISQKPSYSPWS